VRKRARERKRERESERERARKKERQRKRERKRSERERKREKERERERKREKERKRERKREREREREGMPVHAIRWCLFPCQGDGVKQGPCSFFSVAFWVWKTVMLPVIYMKEPCHIYERDMLHI